MIKIVKNLVPSSKYSIKSPYTMTPIGICVHNTANDASAVNEIAYMVRNDLQISFHYAVDDIQAVQGLPENRNGWHAGDGNGAGNRKHIAIEICYSKSGGDRFIKAEQNAVLLIVDILKRYGWGIDKIKKHQDFSGKYCPHRTLDMGWQRFLNMVSKELAGNSWKEEAKALPEDKRIYESTKETALVKIDSGEIVKTYPKGTELEFSVIYKDWYLTSYSFDRGIKNGFRVSDMALKTEPLPEEPVAPTEEEILRKQVADLLKENKGLKINLEASNAEVEELKIEIKGLFDKYDTLEEEKIRIEKERAHFEEENSKLRKQIEDSQYTLIKKIGEFLAKVFSKGK